MAGFMVFPTAGSTEHHGYDGVVDFNRRWLDARRGGGGGGDPIAKPMSVLLLILAVLAVVTKFTRQSNVNASLLAGNIFGFFLLDANPDTKITGEVVKAFTDFGITLVLFFAGLSIQLPERYLPHMFPVTFWYMALVATLFALIGYGASLVEGEERSLAPHILFGVTCTLSSKILAYEYLSVQGEMRSMHGCAIVCVSWFQDLVALVAFAVVNAYQKSLVESGCEGPLGTDATNTTKSTGNMTSGNMSSANSTIAGTYSCSRRAALDLTKFGPVWPPNFNDEVGDNVVLSLAIFFLVLFLHYALSKYFLKRIFRFLCTDSELLFFGVLAYSLGSCALCIQAGFSPFVSAYAAGFAIAQLPSRIQVLQKISAFRAFGIFVFNFMLGIYVKFDPEFFENYFGWAVLLSVIIILVNPIFMSLVGFCFKVKLRTVFITSMLSNNIGEHALILANLGYQAGLFRFEILQTFVAAAQLTMIGTALFHPFLQKFVPKLAPILGHLDRPKKEDRIRTENYNFQNHIAILGFNETGLEIAEFYRQEGKDVVVIDLDWKLHKTFKSCYKGTKHFQDQSESVSMHSVGAPVPMMHPAVDAQLGNVRIQGHYHLPYHQHYHTAGQVVYGSAFGSAPLSPSSAGMQVATSVVPMSPVANGVRIVGPTSPMTSPRSQTMQPQMMPMFNRNFVPMQSGYTLVSNGTTPMPTSGRTSTKKPFLVDGHKFGGGTNIFSIYDDPEDERSWDRYGLKSAAMVVSCMSDDKDASAACLCEYMKDSQTPVMVLCTSNVQAGELYEAGADYVVQQDFLAAKEAEDIIKREMGANGQRFSKLREEHLKELYDEEHDYVMASIGAFI